MPFRAAGLAFLGLLFALSSGAETACLAAGGSAGSAGEDLPPLCGDGVVKDDGSVETGWGWVPSVIDGRYVQVFDSSELAGPFLEEVCVCWLRTRPDDSIDFEVVLYEADAEGRPVAEPFAAFPARAEGVPQGIVGQIVSVDTGDLRLPTGTFFVGVAWNPSVDQFFFVCADTTETTPRVEVFFIDDRADDWTSVFESQDPIFLDHRAIVVRATARPAEAPLEIPTLSTVLLGLLALGLVLAGWSRLGSSRHPR